MRQTSLSKRIILTIHLSVGLLGGFSGYLIIKHFELLARGLLGISTIVLIYLLFFPPKNIIQGFPDKIDLMDIVINFCLLKISSWAIYSIILMIRYYLL
jgi:hypothetical protein